MHLCGRHRLNSTTVALIDHRHSNLLHCVSISSVCACTHEYTCSAIIMGGMEMYAHIFLPWIWIYIYIIIYYNKCNVFCTGMNVYEEGLYWIHSGLRTYNFSLLFFYPLENDSSHHKANKIWKQWRKDVLIMCINKYWRFCWWRKFSVTHLQRMLKKKKGKKNPEIYSSSHSSNGTTVKKKSFFLTLFESKRTGFGFLDQNSNDND